VRPHLPSAGRRFVNRLGFSLVQAAIFGSLVGLGVFFRSDRVSLEEAQEGNLSLKQRLIWPLEWLELVSFDWRAREAGRASDPIKDVVLVTLDQETLANAREDEHEKVASQPFPRELYGQMARHLMSEGADLTVFDLPFLDMSPKGEPGTDDARFGKLLEEGKAPVALGFVVSARAPPPLSRSIRPHLVRVGEPQSEVELWVLVQRALSERRTVYALPEGARTGVWVGVATEEDGRALAKKWLPKEEPALRDLIAQDRAFQVDTVALAVKLSEVDVEGLKISGLPQVRWLRPPVAPLLRQGTALGFLGLTQDRDGVVRGAQLLYAYVGPRGDAHVLPSLPLAAAMRRLGSRSLRYGAGRLWLGERVGVPMDAQGYSLLTWSAGETGADGHGTFQRSVSAWQLIRNVLDEEVGLPAHYRNDVLSRTAVVADLASGPGGWVPTPVGSAVAPGAVLGQALSNLLSGAGVGRMDPKVDLTFTFLMAFAGAFLALSFSGIFRSVLGALVYFGSFLAATATYLALSRYLFLARNEWLAVAGPLVALTATFAATTLYALRTQMQMREFLESVLGRYVSPEVTRQVLGNVALIRPERREVTLCISDLEGFNRLLEALSPEKLVELLNEYFTEMTTVVRQHGGQVEYTGDAMMAFFGAPVRTERHAQLACHTALAMRQALGRHQAPWERRFGQRLSFRTGIFTGEVLVGDMGSSLKSNYTVMGEPVSLAEWMESANREYGTHILAGERTRELAGEAFVFREVDEVSIRGQVVRVLELVGSRGEVGRAQKARLERFETALERYRGADFQGALNAFSELAQDDRVAQLYLGRCERALEQPKEGRQVVP
jgi:adenylate cyclase